MSNRYDNEYEPLPPLWTMDDNESREGPFWDWYRDYLKSPQWKKTSRAAIKRAGGTCQMCQDAPATQAHHLDYTRVGRERPEDVQAVCDPCHRPTYE
jgi:5-methylcytosine-specific restriction endonuclease McrA